MNGTTNRVRTVFADAMEIADHEERKAYLSKVCGTDLILRGEVEELLRAQAHAGGFLPARPLRSMVAQLPMAGDPSTVQPQTEQAGERIGHYKLLQKIGEGGCGTVFLAQQEQPLRRRIALKVIKLGMDTRSVVARFEAERHALAMMDHPNIAKVLDAGATDRGRPFFVMELVHGTALTGFCDQHLLTVRQRLELFLQVCSAIHHAHQKGIIHRDIKPSNVLVTIQDGVPVPKIIDFGIAKATQGRLTEHTLFTTCGQLIGTPAYMSPEQAEMVEIDACSDVYSLGVVLYELLTGETPFNAAELLASGLEAMRRTIRELEPMAPSVGVCTLSVEQLTTTARCRGIDALKLSKVIRGDLDCIVLKCLEKERARRYQTVHDLATDIQCHLANQPVAAVPASTAYRLHRLMSRNKLFFAATSSVIAALFVSIGMVGLGYHQLALIIGAKDHEVIEARLKEASVLYATRGAAALRNWADEKDTPRDFVRLIDPFGKELFLVASPDWIEWTAAHSDLDRVGTGRSIVRLLRNPERDLLVQGMTLPDHSVLQVGRASSNYQDLLIPVCRSLASTESVGIGATLLAGVWLSHRALKVCRRRGAEMKARFRILV